MSVNISWFESFATCKGRGRWILAVLPLWVAGCQSPHPPEATASPCWPSPPARPCIRFVQAAEMPVDFGVSPKFWQKTLNLLVGGDRGN